MRATSPALLVERRDVIALGAWSGDARKCAQSNEPAEASVVDWSTLPRRLRRPPPPSYWEEYVETDTLYQKKLIEDVPFVPEEELHSALIAILTRIFPP